MLLLLLSVLSTLVISTSLYDGMILKTAIRTYSGRNEQACLAIYRNLQMLSQHWSEADVQECSEIMKVFLNQLLDTATSETQAALQLQRRLLFSLHSDGVTAMTVMTAFASLYTAIMVTEKAALGQLLDKLVGEVVNANNRMHSLYLVMLGETPPHLDAPKQAQDTFIRFYDSGRIAVHRRNINMDYTEERMEGEGERKKAQLILHAVIYLTAIVFLDALSAAPHHSSNLMLIFWVLWARILHPALISLSSNTISDSLLIRKFA